LSNTSIFQTVDYPVINFLENLASQKIEFQKSETKQDLNEPLTHGVITWHSFSSFQWLCLTFNLEQKISIGKQLSSPALKGSIQ
jgi:hypothetical protein